MSTAPIDTRPYTMAASLLSHVADALTSLPCVLYCCVVLLCAVAVYLLAALNPGTTPLPGCAAQSLDLGGPILLSTATADANLVRWLTLIRKRGGDAVLKRLF